MLIRSYSAEQIVVMQELPTLSRFLFWNKMPAAGVLKCSYRQKVSDVLQCAVYFGRRPFKVFP